MVFTERERQWSLKILNHLFKWNLTTSFRKQIDLNNQNCPNYKDIIQRPISLETVKKALLNGKYLTVDLFISDLKLIFQNAQKYYGDNSVMFFIADEILHYISKNEIEIHLTSYEVWLNHLAEIQSKIDQHMKDMPANFKPPISNK